MGTPSKSQGPPLAMGEVSDGTLWARPKRDVHLLQASLHTLGTHLAVHAGPGALPMLAHSLGHCSYDPFTSSHLTQTQEVNIALDPVKRRHSRGMKHLLLLTVGLSLAWALQDQSRVPVQQDFSPEQVTGHWSTLNLASTDRSVIEEGGAYQCFMTGIALLDNGNLNVTYLHRQDGKCVKEFYVAEKTGIPGRYTFDYQGKNYLTFVAVTEEFTIMDLENQSEGNTLIVVELHGRTLYAGKLGLEPYKSHTSRRGIVPDNIMDVSLNRKPTFLQLLLCGTPGTVAVMTVTPLEVYAIGHSVKGTAG
ncbi:trichosurin [Cricetulus griseus]|uniref:Trichosurin n=2 Tax=Cricetulus griseus TaxID=10029 RepID=A0A9J7GCF1_CRIGR|nr:trichosurin [Cricetulus griseus]XP_027278528.1 trichosurin [Cricetulus griseus]